MNFLPKSKACLQLWIDFLTRKGECRPQVTVHSLARTDELLVKVLHPAKACPKSFQTVTAISFELVQSVHSSESELLEEEVDSSLTAILIIVGAGAVWLVVSKQKEG